MHRSRKRLGIVILLIVALGIVLITPQNANAATVRTVVYEQSYRSLVGLTVCRHKAITTFTFGSQRLYNDPRNIDTDPWTALFNYVGSQSEQWDWYQSQLYGTGRSNSRVTFVFGVPTPWGPVGSTTTSRIYTNVSYTGAHSAWSP